LASLGARKIFDARLLTVCIDSIGTSEHNCMYVNPVEVKQLTSARQGGEQPGWRQNIYLLPVVLFLLSAKA